MESALDGEGARLAGGRWNLRGTRVVYTSESLSLATLETLVHASPGQLLLARLVTVKIVIPDDMAYQEVAAAQLPANWRDYPAPTPLQQLGQDWLRKGDSALLRVPSAVIPDEHNILINPMHRDFERVKVASTAPFDPDPRLRK